MCVACVSVWASTGERKRGFRGILFFRLISFWTNVFLAYACSVLDRLTAVGMAISSSLGCNTLTGMWCCLCGLRVFQVPQDCRVHQVPQEIMVRGWVKTGLILQLITDISERLILYTSWRFNCHKINILLKKNRIQGNLSHTSYLWNWKSYSPYTGLHLWSPPLESSEVPSPCRGTNNLTQLTTAAGGESKGWCREMRCP